MPTTKTRSNKTPAKSPSQGNVVTESAPPEVLPRSSSSSLEELYSKPEFSLAWDNDIKHHIASNLLHLRRYRGDSQTDVANAIGTSQSAIARIEAGEENFTANTIERIVAALRGRFFFRIQPEEFGFQRRTPWWAEKMKAQTDWSVLFVAHQASNSTERVVIGMERTTAPHSLIVSGNTWGKTT